jgi:hypothetical protein
MGRAKPTLLRRVERRVVSGGIGVMVFFLERIVLRSARKSQNK